MQLSAAAYAVPHPHKTRFNYQPTILTNAGLLKRLSIEVTFLLFRMKASWPAFKQNPLGFARRAAAELLQAPAVEHRALATTVALFVVCSSVLFVLIKSGTSRTSELTLKNADDASVQMLELAPEAPTPIGDKAIGIGFLGRVGLDRGKGEGSHPEPREAQGGGSGGDHRKLPVSRGPIPQPSEIPAPIPTEVAKRNPALPAAGIDIDPELWRLMAAPVYGDPRSAASNSSNGSGEGGGIGTKVGQGVGDGNGDGFGTGWDGNIGGDKQAPGGGRRGGGLGNPPKGAETILRASMVDQRARVLSKPEPQYTEDARRNQIMGTVVLHAVFSKTGEVTNIRAVSSLPFGLTERAIAAARQIKFLPATRDNRPVSVHMQLEYNFNLY